MDEQDERHSSGPAEASADTSPKQGRRRNRRRRSSRSQADTPAVVEQAQSIEATPDQPEERPRTGNAAKPKRRNAPRRTAFPEQLESPHIFRTNPVQLAPLQPMRLRPIDGDDTSEPMIGCPMLTRTRLGLPFRGGNRVARCSVGWAVHDEDEVLFCMHTPTAAQCWKEHPENVEALAEHLRPIIEAELAVE